MCKHAYQGRRAWEPFEDIFLFAWSGDSYHCAAGLLFQNQYLTSHPVRITQMAFAASIIMEIWMRIAFSASRRPLPILGDSRYSKRWRRAGMN